MILFGNIIITVVSILVTCLGLSIYRGNINLIHDYHHSRVKEEDKLDYVHKMGMLTILVGVFLFISYFGLMIFDMDKYIPHVLIIESIVMTISIVYIQRKYNKGVF